MRLENINDVLEPQNQTNEISLKEIQKTLKKWQKEVDSLLERSEQDAWLEKNNEEILSFFQKIASKVFIIKPKNKENWWLQKAIVYTINDGKVHITIVWKNEKENVENAVSTCLGANNDGAVAGNFFGHLIDKDAKVFTISDLGPEFDLEKEYPIFADVLLIHPHRFKGFPLGEDIEMNFQPIELPKIPAIEEIREKLKQYADGALVGDVALAFFKSISGVPFKYLFGAKQRIALFTVQMEKIYVSKVVNDSEAYGGVYEKLTCELLEFSDIVPSKINETAEFASLSEISNYAPELWCSTALMNDYLTFQHASSRENFDELPKEEPQSEFEKKMAIFLQTIKMQGESSAPSIAKDFVQQLATNLQNTEYDLLKNCGKSCQDVLDFSQNADATERKEVSQKFAEIFMDSFREFTENLSQQQ